MLGLNTTGTVISTELQTFQPGKLSTGQSSIGEHIAYSIYDENGTLNVVTTRRFCITAIARAGGEAARRWIYGYTVEDVNAERQYAGLSTLVPRRSKTRASASPTCV